MWKYYECVDIFISDSFKIRNKNRILILDLDGTLITRANGKNPSYNDKDPYNWEFLGDVPEMLNKYKKKKYTIFILTNQGWGQNYLDITRQRINSVKDKLIKINGWSPYFIVVNSKNNKYRKPNTQSINIIFSLLNIKLKNIELINDLIPDDLDENSIEKILISGDAIGDNDPYPPYRWSSVDYDFFENVEELFSETFFYKPLDLFPSNSDELFEKINENIIIMVGNQGSGKTTFSEKLTQKGYVHLEKDKISTIPKLIKMAKECLKKGENIIIDKTNPKIEDRKIWIDLAKDYNKSFSIIWSVKNGNSFNLVRDKPIPSIVYNIYSKNFQQPENKEGSIYKLW